MNTDLKNNDEFHKILEYLEENPEKSQREISSELDYSLGKVNFLIKELTKVGIIKLDRFLNSNSKWSYRYVFTPKGIQKKIEITKLFLKRKEAEYKNLKNEIEKLKIKIGDT